MSKHFIISILFLVAAVFLQCSKKAAPQSSLIPLPASLAALPEDSTISLGKGIFITRVSDTKAVLEIPPAGPRKSKCKNCGNDYSKTKDSGNTDSFNKKSGNTGSFTDSHKSQNTDLKRVSNPLLNNSGTAEQVITNPPDLTNNTNSGILPVFKTVMWCLILLIIAIIIYRVIKVFR